ncbi:PTS sugar transporter subunit IIB [Anaerofustis sp.]|uniref:PTS sugar transporter subunit IIB n=1 Tax=Anaerofustis sp. TaxID=1872517 RepID=UPI0025C50E5E|nr:PTS sugar transporter subunit IIB [Anaerofustis sp.]
MKTILVACGTAIATSTVVAKKVTRLCEQNNIEVKTIQCKAEDAASRAKEILPDLVISTCDLPGAFPCKTVSGRPFLTGIKLQECIDELLEVLKN